MRGLGNSRGRTISFKGQTGTAGLPASEMIRTMLHELVEQIFAAHNREAVEFSCDLREVARAVYDSRRARSSILPLGLFGEPAWDILLDLYANDGGSGASTEHACLAADVPYSTAWRCLGALEADGLIERFHDTHDARRNLVRLTRQGQMAVRQCVRAAAGLRAG